MSCITVDVNDNEFILTGDIEAITSSRRARSNFASYGASFEKKGKIVLEFSTEEELNDSRDGDAQYQAIEKLLKKFNIDYKNTKETEIVIERYLEDTRNFQDFSTKARDIRNNNHKPGDFQRFVDVSHTLLRKLYPLQLLSSYHLAFSQNACNFSVPGAGKTTIVYGAYAYLKHTEKVDRMLIISPLSAFAPWKDEYKICFGTQASVKELVGVSQRDRQHHFYSEGYTEITLISYQSASGDNDVEHIKAYLQRNNVMVVLDEAHRIKNVEGGKWADAILSIAKFAKSRIVLTGTPAPNGYQDLCNLYKFIWPSKKIISLPVSYLQSISKDHTPSAKENIKQLISDIAPFFIRIRKSDLDLPNPIENKPLEVQMSESQRKIYDCIEQDLISHAKRSVESDNFGIYLKSAKLIRLMQCATNLNLLKKPLDDYLVQAGADNNLGVNDKDILKLINAYNPQLEVPSKFPAILDLLRTITGNHGAKGKAVIWTIFIQNIYDLRDYLNDNGMKCEVLYGGVPNENADTPENVTTREAIIHEFHQEDCDYKIIIANPFAVGEAISLHHACHNAIYLEKNFNAAMYMQSKDRIHRCGLKKDDVINYYYLLSSDSIDSTIHRRVLEKEKAMLDTIEHEEIPLLSMNMEEGGDFGTEGDIRSIINDYQARRSTSA